MSVVAVDYTVVEVFKTDVDNKKTAILVVEKLKRLLPKAKINFDLDDCDNILRIEGNSAEINANAIIVYTKELGVKIEILG